jgi:hypothetical protein
MLHQNETQTVGIAPQSAAAGVLNGGWVSVAGLLGDLNVAIVLGAVTGSVVVKLQDATDSSGTGAADIPGATTASLTAANAATVINCPVSASRGFVQVVATVTGGPVLIAASIGAMAKYPAGW